MVKAILDNREIEVEEGTTVLEAARRMGIEIPTLCDHPAIEPYGGAATGIGGVIR
ncbi:MAG: 2Fe-2S iron-sulfur cluster-binding protein, partial [Chlamydiota bacterium]